jgi:pimeloyl-ACP methyl ester carboxylesterase
MYNHRFAPPDRRSVLSVGGCEIEYSVWVAEDPQALILVPGAAAHTAWWDPVASILRGRRTVVTLDLSGHGNSGWRTDYSVEQWAEEIASVACEISPGPHYLIGHSMGGKLALLAAFLCGAAGAVLVDAAIREDGKRSTRRLRTASYPTQSAALGAFRLLPGQPTVDQQLLRYIAERSIKRTSKGWTWKFDPHVFGSFDDSVFLRLLRRPEFPVAYVRGAMSELTSVGTPARLGDLLDCEVVAYEIETAHHHVTIDAPAALADVIEALIARWRNGSDGHARPSRPDP